MRNNDMRIVLILSTLTFLAGCDDDKTSGTDTAADTAPDTTADAAPDTTVDSADDAVDSADAAADSADAAVDSADAAPDTTVDSADAAADSADAAVDSADAAVDSADAAADSADTTPACSDGRECGVDPVTHAFCGDCTTPGLLACNDGRCEATCDDAACGAMSYSSSTCVAASECDGTPDGFSQTMTFSCNAEHTVCDFSATAIDCGFMITECMPCDFAGTDDGRCHNDVCVAPDQVVCE